MKTNGFSMAPNDMEEQKLPEYSIDKPDSAEPTTRQRTGINVSLMAEVGKMKSLWLPDPPVGKYWFENKDDSIGESIWFEAKNGRWYAYCLASANFKTQYGRTCREIEITDQCIFSVHNADYHSVVYCEEVNSYSGIFRNYYVEQLAEIYIGRANTNDIVYPNMLVSQTHAILRRSKKGWSILDCNSTNGVFVNGLKTNNAELKLGDHVYIMGLRIIIGVGFISINDSNERVRITSLKLRRLTSTEDLRLPVPCNSETQEVELFNRLPRKRRALETKPITIEAPPMSMNSNSMPLLLRMGGPLVMSSSALLAGHITSMLSSVLFPVLTQKYSDKQRKEYEEKRYEKYTKHLADKNAEIKEELNAEQTVLTENYPELSDVLTFVDSGKRLWERRKTDDDFLSLRIGSGRREMLAKVDYPQRSFSMDEDPLMTQMYELAERRVYLENAPVLVPFVEDFVCGVLGPKKLSLSFVQRIIMQLCLLHSYDEAKIVVLAEKEDLKKIEFVKYLPHIWNDQRDFRFLATSTSEAYQISEHLKGELEQDLVKQRELKEILKTRPYYMVFALSKRIFDSMEVLKDVMQADQNCGVSVLTVFDDLPKECVKIFELRASGEHSIIHLKQIEKANESFRMDSYDTAAAESSMKKISNTSLKIVTQAYSLPKMITFLEMFGVGRVEHLNPLKRWKENNPVKSLATPIGVATDGSLFTLDLHEKYQGPHGLVAGMTGSGKSEFIITYILSMAINYHPDEVAFILIDYKGGGLADAFENSEKGIHLPHVVGTITNLDGASIQRSLRSLHSEVMRRQRVLKEAKKKTDEGTMDIYKYQKYYRNGQLDEPMPHLFIVSDEFAELKQQKPEFMDSLISIARIGRSLGVHLILATQKPSGVVNDQIRSNTKFRVCLKVQDKSDSQDMLKRSEAAELKDTGRFYLQVGYNEFFALGQSAWSGADYEPQDNVVVKKDDSVQVIDSVGQNLYEAKIKAPKIKDGRSQLNAVVALLSDIAQEAGIRRKSLWKPELPTELAMAKVDKFVDWKPSAPTEVLVGVVDDPENQAQFPLLYDAGKDASLLIMGEQGSGKTAMIQNILLSLVKNCGPEQVNLYILDYSSRMLSMYKKMPHCGAVLLEEESDSLDNFFGIVNGIVAERKKQFSAMGVNSYSAANAITPIPLILVVIDGFTGLKASRIGESHVYGLKEYIKSGYNYGVKYIISCNHTSDISSKIRQELGCVFTLQLKDKFEYSEALKHSVPFIPTAMPGRGLIYTGEVGLEYQAVTLYKKTGSPEYLEKMKAELEVIRNRNRGCATAKRLPVLTATATYEEFAEQFSRGRIPLGYALRTKKTVALPLKQFDLMSVYFGDPKGTVPLFENLIFAAEREKMDLRIVPRLENSCFDTASEKHVSLEQNEHAMIMGNDPDSLVALWKFLFAEVTKRRVYLQEYCTAHGLEEKQADIRKHTYTHMAQNTTPMLVLIENLLDFASKLDPASALVFERLLRACRKCNIYFIAGIEPGDDQKDDEVLIFGSFTSNGCVLFSGGQLDKQSIYMFDEKVIKDSQQHMYNRCWMRYGDDVYPLLIPCGVIEEKTVDEDDSGIF